MNRQLYKKIAKKHGVSVRDVKRDLKEAVNYVTPNEEMQKMSSFNGSPTTDNVIAYIIERTNKNHVLDRK